MYDEFELICPVKTQRAVDELCAKMHKQCYNQLQYRCDFHHPRELQTLYEIARGYHDEIRSGNYAMQIGTFGGATACVIAKAIYDSGVMAYPLISLDSYNKQTGVLEEGTLTLAYELARKNIHTLGLEKYVMPIMYDGAQFIFRFWQFPLRMVFIDAFHEYEDVARDINAVSKHIAPGGWIILHDYCNIHEGVMRATNEYIERHRNGIRVYQVNSDRNLIVIQKNVY